MGLFLSQTPIFLQDVPCGMCPSKGGLKTRFKLTFPSFFSQFSMLVTLWVSPIPTLEGGPGSGSLRRHLRLPSSLRWDNPTPHKDTSSKKSQTPCSGAKIPQEFTMRSHTQTWDRAVSPIWPWHRRCLPDILTPPWCLWKHQESPSQVRQCTVWMGMPKNMFLVWHKDFCNPTQDQGWLCLLHTLGVSIPCQPPGSNTSQKWAVRTVQDNAWPHQGWSPSQCHHQGILSLLQAEFTQLLSLSQSWRRPWRSSCARCWSVLSPH